MSNYVLKRTDQGGGYVAKVGNKSSYTNAVRNMRKFDTVADADADRCVDNEVVVPISEVID